MARGTIIAQSAPFPPPTAHRIHAIDYLRGLFALSILVYHYAVWSGHATLPVLHQLGLYGVAAFYVISGLSFGYVYRTLPMAPRPIAAFWIKRLFRLAPLYWIATLGAVVLLWPARPRLDVLAANLTLTFGLVRPAAYLPTGGWSIGNEVAFYLVLPVLLWALRARPWVYGALLALSVALAAWFAFTVLEPTATLSDQWAHYVNPLNQVVLFVAGVGAASAIGRVHLSARVSYALLAVLAGVFLLLPATRTDAGQIVLVTGWPRLAYVTVCVLFCTVGALGAFPMPRRVAQMLAWLGQTSYAIYLLHPVTHHAIARLWPALSPGTVVLVAVPLTFLLVHVVYRGIEAPMIRVGARVARAVNRRVTIVAVSHRRPPEVGEVVSAAARQ